MWNFIDETNRIFWVRVLKSGTGKKMEEIHKQFPGEKSMVIVQNKEHQYMNGYKDISSEIKVDYKTENIIFVELNHRAECPTCNG